MGKHNLIIRKKERKEKKRKKKFLEAFVLPKRDNNKIIYRGFVLRRHGKSRKDVHT
jgi:hypothetical protein